jgi:hypothetical protein
VWRSSAADAAVRALRLCGDLAGLALQACALLTNLGSTCACASRPSVV